MCRVASRLRPAGANINRNSVCFSAFDVKSKELKVNEQIWLPLVASTGPSMSQQDTSGISKIANSVVIPLADQGISVYPLSTYRTDYVLVSLLLFTSY